MCDLFIVSICCSGHWLLLKGWRALCRVDSLWGVKCFYHSSAGKDSESESDHIVSLHCGLPYSYRNIINSGVNSLYTVAYTDTT